MTSEEAILLSAYTGFLLAPDFSKVHKFCEDTLGRPNPQIMELIKKISALRPVSREQVEKAWRGEWKLIGSGKNGRGGVWHCTRCEKSYPYKCDFCPRCGAPMTDEAVNMVLERLEALRAALNPPDEPLTLEQLRQMDGEPVYIPETNCWVLVTKNPFVPLFTWPDREQCSAYDWYEQVGPAYRRPQEESTNE